MMSDTENKFEIQTLSIQNKTWKVILNYESCFASRKELLNFNYNSQIELGEPGEYTSMLSVEVEQGTSIIKSCIIKGINGGCFLHTLNENDNSQSVKLVGND